NLFARWFYVLLLPLVTLMFVAILTRISFYGLTEPRVLVLALAIWLAGISLCYTFRPEGDIRIIPLSLVTVLLLISAGPLSMFGLSRHSQRQRLVRILEENHLLRDGRAIASATSDTLGF